MDDMTAFERQIGEELRREIGLVPSFDTTAIARVAVASTPPGRWSDLARRLRGGITPAPAEGGFSVFSALKYVAAGVIVALFGGFLLAGVLTTPQESEVLPAAVTVSPSPMTTEELLPRLVTDEVEPGVYRVRDDGVRDLASADIQGVAAGYDGNVWLLLEDEFLRLGSETGHAWPNGSRPPVDSTGWLGYGSFEVTPNGTVWVIDSKRVPHPRDGFSDVGSLHSFTGDGWNRVQTPGNDLFAIAVAPDGTLWATWREWNWNESQREFHVDSGVGHLGPSGWEPLVNTNGIVNRLYPTDSGVLYAADCYYGSCVVLRYGEGEGAWSDFGDGRGTFDVAPDGTIWFLRTEEGHVRRYAGDEWASWTPEELPDMGLGIALEGYPPLSTTFMAAPDGSLWASLWKRGTDGHKPPAGGLWTFEQRLEAWEDDGGRYDPQCDGLVRFDGTTADRFLPGRCITMDIATDGSVWVLADEDEGKGLYVITPEAVAAKEAEATESPPVEDATDTSMTPTATTDLLSDMVTEEVEPGVFRVVEDGVRDLAPDNALVVGDDGSVWLVHPKGFSRPGGDAVAYPPGAERLDFVTPDGTLWSGLNSYDGEKWTAHPEPPCWWCSFYDLDGTIWAAWMEPEQPSWTVAELTGDGWRPLDAPLEPWGPDAEPGGWLERLTSIDGELWAWTWTESAPGTGVMSRWADGEWQDVFRVQEDEPWALGLLAMGSDGTTWFSDDDNLRSLDGDEWNGWSLDDLKAVVPLAEASMSGIGVAPDGGLWVWLGETWPEGRSEVRGEDSPECHGVARFDDGRWDRYLEDLCTEAHMGPDGSVWALAGTGYHPGEGLGNTWDLYVITPEAVAAKEAEATESPPVEDATDTSMTPTATTDLLSDMVTEEVEPGVFRVVEDGVRDLEVPGASLLTPSVRIVAGADGSVWRFAERTLHRLGSDETYELDAGDWPDLIGDVVVAHDGTLWAAKPVVAGERGAIRSFDGETWTLRQEAPQPGHIDFVTVAPDGEIWAGWSDYEKERSRVGRFDGQGWQLLPGETDGERLWVTHTGERWLAYPGSFSSFQIPGPLHHFGDDGWQEVETPGAVRTSISPDGTVWRSDLTRIDATGTMTWDVPAWVATVGEPGGEWHQFEAAPDGSLWVSELWDWDDLSIVCDGVARFDGSTWSRYLRGLCIHGMDFARDGAVWLAAGDVSFGENGHEVGPIHTFVITPEAVAAAESEVIEPPPVEEPPDPQLSPTTADDLLSGMVTEETEPGVYRVLDDGVRDLMLPTNTDIVAGHDGGIWLLRQDRIYRLGEAATHPWPEDGGPHRGDFEVTPDGTVWVTMGRGAPFKGDLFSSDGEGWTRVNPSPGGVPWPYIVVAPDGTLWASWDGQVRYLGPTGWQALPVEPIEPGLEVDAPGALYVTDAGDLYGAWFGLFRYEDGAWRPFLWSIGRFDIGPDGTIWQLGRLAEVRPGGLDYDTLGDGLARFADGEWELWGRYDLTDMGLGVAFSLADEFMVAPDGSLWAPRWQAGDDPLTPGRFRSIWDLGKAMADDRVECDGVARFDGETVDHYLPGRCISMDIAPDGAVWVLADEEGDRGLYVITPDAVAATE